MLVRWMSLGGERERGVDADKKLGDIGRNNNSSKISKPWSAAAVLVAVLLVVVGSNSGGEQYAATL